LTLPSALLDRIDIKDAVITADARTLSAATPPTWLGGAHYLLIANLVIVILRLAGATSIATACAITPAGPVGQCERS
jgi:hypothetical protein